MQTIVCHSPAISSLNLGDEIIAESAKQYLKRLFPADFFVDVSTHLPLSKEYMWQLRHAAWRFVLGSNLLRGIAQKNLVLIRKIRCMSPRTTREKLMEFLLDQAKECGSSEFVIPYDRQALADYLGVERSAMSAEIGKLRKDGLIETGGAWFRVAASDGK